MLYFVATPIGNLKDISYRAIEVLSNSDCIFCEDTRVSSVLLNHYNINKPLYSNHKFNESKVAEKIISLAKEGKNISVISDCGCPIISDPGLVLAKKLHENNIAYSVVPGANACITALMLSAFDSYRFCFLGFLPEKNIDRQKVLQNVKDFEGSIVFYLSPHSLEKDIQYICSILGERDACLVKEITKIYETVTYFRLGQPLDIVKKGEFVLIVKGCEPQAPTQDIDIEATYRDLLSQNIASNKAIAQIAKLTGRDRNEIYMQLKGK